MPEIYIMRHGLTRFNLEHRFQGRADVPLNRQGLEQASEAGRILRGAGIVPDRIYCSPLHRAMQTAENAFLVSENDLIPDARLAEITFGWIDACPADCIPEGFADNFFHNPGGYIPPENGESYPQLLTRVTSVLEDLRKDTSGDVIFVVSHAGVLHAILNVLTQAPLQEFWTYKIENCGVIRLHLQPERRLRTTPGHELPGQTEEGTDWFEEIYRGFPKNSIL